MIPVILVAKDKTLIDAYIDKVEKKYQRHYVFKIHPHGKEISIDQIRSIKKLISIKTDQPRLFILYDFQTASIEAQNSFLKSLEEKIDFNNFYLISQSEYSLLPTIRSRAKVIYLNEKLVAKNTVKEKNPVAALLLRIMEDKGRSCFFLADSRLQNPTREEVTLIIDQIIEFSRRHIVEFGLPAAKIIKKAVELRHLLTVNNLNPALTLDFLLIFIAKQFTMKVSDKL